MTKRHAREFHWFARGFLKAADWFAVAISGLVLVNWDMSDRMQHPHPIVLVAGIGLFALGYFRMKALK
jgi:hypothetical protein